MGANVSSNLSKNEQLNRFVSPEPLSPNHPFWNRLLSYQLQPHPRSKADCKQFEERVEELCKRFTVNNLKSGNFGSLLQVFLTREIELKSSLESSSSVFVWQTQNALFILRTCIKFFIERLKEEDVYRQFEATSKQPTTTTTNSEETSTSSSSTAPRQDEVLSSDRFETFMKSIFDIIIDLPLKDMTYSLHLEVMTTLLILLSTPLYSSRPAFQARSYKIIMNYEKNKELTVALLNRFMEQAEAPSSFLNEDGIANSGLVVGLASGVWNILTLGYSSVVSSAAPQPQIKPVANLGLLLILVLTNHCTDVSASSSIAINPYRKNLFELRNHHPLADKENEEKNKTEKDGEIYPEVDFPELFKTLVTTLETDESTLLLYLLLHQNEAFRTFIFASSDVDLLVVPILKTLYHAPTSNNHHIYMSLIILLILSEDDLFNTSVHDCMLKNVDWYGERALSEISLGGLLILVVIRTIQYNMLKMRDKYLHTNCLAALANMSSQFRNLHPYVSQRIVSMFEALAKKHARLISTIHQSGDLEGLEEDSPISDALSDAQALEEVLRMILEIINSCLGNQIKNNPNLIYTLLYKRELFSPFGTHPSFQDLAQNLQTVINYFTLRLEQIQEKKERTLSVSEVQEVIRQTAMQFPREKLMKFPDLKFKYVEEEQPEDFFVPYIWTLATHQQYWNPNYVKLFAPVNE